MLLSRFWYLALSVAAIMGLTAALLACGILNRQRLAAADEGLRRDRFEIESLLKLDARARLDTLAPIAADATVREAVREKGEGRIDGLDAPKALLGKLHTLNQQLEELRADLLIAVDANGVIVAQEGRKPARAGAGLGRVPLVENALSGYLSDDVWVYDNHVYRMAARPIVDRGQYAGALVHAQRMDATLAQRLSERLGGASVAFFFRDEIIASYTPTDVPGAPTQAEMAAPLKQVLADERLRKGERTGVVELGGGGRAVYSLVAGSASSMEVGYSVARPVKLLASPWAMFDETTKDDVAMLPHVQLVSVLAVLLLLAMLTVYLERDRPLSMLRTGLDSLAEGKLEELDLATLSGSYRKLGERINRALSVAVEKTDGGKRRAQKANLDEILGPAPESLASSAFSFGSAEAPSLGSGGGGVNAGVPAPTPMPAPVSMHAPVPAQAPLIATPVVPAQRPTPVVGAGGRVGVPSVPRPPPPRVPGHAVGMVQRTANNEENSVMLKLDGSQNDDGDPTVIAEIPDQLRNASRDDEQHFREVFSQYVALRRDCGESTEELTYEKFAATLRKNRDQIMATRQNARDVRFTVYAKAGKASLKATPVKA